uniref:Uncharacterized protein n=1 Tax=uncultured bacterium contig00054 TaxID=1181538 RepID=A0A806K1R4_9BACT|nr:hypothetical protein [uncultured bacterium contig00054]
MRALTEKVPGVAGGGGAKRFLRFSGGGDLRIRQRESMAGKSSVLKILLSYM